MACQAKLGRCPCVSQFLGKRVELPRVAILVVRIAKFVSWYLCGTGTDWIGIRQANYPSGKGKQMYRSHDETMNAYDLYSSYGIPQGESTVGP